MREALKGGGMIVALAVPVLAALAVGAMDFDQVRVPRAAEPLLFILVAALAAAHRPLGGAGLGLGALALAPATDRLGAAVAALVAGTACLLANALRRASTRRPVREWNPGRELVAAALVAAAAFAGTALWASGILREAAFAWRALAPAAAQALAFAVLVAAGGRVRLGRWRGLWPAATASGFAALGLDAAGWVLGALISGAASDLGWRRAAPILLALALLAAEAGRNALARGASDHRVGDYERLHQAHERILGETSGMGAVAQQIRVECSNILPVQWFQLELEVTEEGERSRGPRSWSAGPDGVLTEGRPRPEPRPRTLPGVHRRVDWRILEEPLVVEGETEAVVRLWCDPRRIEPGAEELFATLRPQMASAVHRARLDREARLDPLTDVPVRRLLDSALQRAFRRSCQEGRPLAVIMCDVDHFKQVNDTHGHAAGDQALIRVARALDAERREHDLLARYGGEEFTLLLESTSGAAALRLAERLRESVAAIALEHEGRTIPLTLSAGVAAFPDLHIKTASELLVLADEALYEAKRRGRDRSLLNLGRGVFRAAGGETVGERVEPARAPPRLFG